MRRVVCNEVGALENLVIEDAPALVAGPGQVVVDVRASGVNFVDGLFVKGAYQIKPPTPFTPGGEVAGVVSSVGDGADGYVVGDRVIASTGLGGFAEQVVAGVGSLFPLPDAISFEIGAALVQSYATALFTLTRRTTVGSGDWVMVLGAGGGVGRACVDVARSLGAHVIGVASSEEKRNAAIAAGAEGTIDPSAEDVKLRARQLSGGGIDVVVDPVRGSIAEACLRALRWDGRYLVVGFASGEIPRLPLNHILLNDRMVIGVDWGAWGMRNPDENRILILEALDAVASGRLAPQAPTIVPLDSVVDALRDLEQRRTVGKVVLV